MIGIRIKLPFIKDKILNVGFTAKSLPSKVNDPTLWPNTPTMLRASGNDKNTAEQLKCYQGWVSDCVSLISERIASIPLKLYKKGELIEEHPFYDLFQRFNPDTTKFMGKELLSTYLGLTGKAYILMLKDRLGIPRELYFRRPDLTTPVIHKGIIDHYKYQEGTKEVNYKREDILYFRYPHPVNPFDGASPVQRKAYIYDTDLYNMIYQLNIFKNGAHLKGIIETETNMSKEQAKKILQLFEDTYGGVDRSHKTGALVGGMKYRTVGMSNRDMEFMLLAEWTMRHIASAYHIPPQKLSHPEKTNLGNMETLDISYNRECILPRCVRKAEVLNAFLIPLYKDNGIYCAFDNPVPADKEFELKKRESDLKHFVITPNEARKEDGLKDESWGKVPLVNSNIVPLGTALDKPEKEKGFEEIEKTLPDNVINCYIENDENVIKRYNEETKKKVWDNFVAKATVTENNFRRELVKFFQEQELKVLRALRGLKKSVEVKISDSDVDRVLRITHSERELSRFADVALPNITEAVKVNGTDAFIELGVGGSFDVTNPLVLEWVKENTARFVKGVTETTVNSLRDTLGEGIMAGESIPKLASRVSAVYSGIKSNRAKAIARTETIRASNAGAEMAYMQSGVVEGKEWVTAFDERTCDEICPDMNGRTAILSSDFDTKDLPVDLRFNEGKMPYPPVHVNCRCCIVPVLKEIRVKPVSKQDKVIATFNKKYAGAKIEHCIGVDKDGKVLLKKSGGKSSISFTAEECQKIKSKEGIIFTHNHPSSKSFSYQDVNMLAYMEKGEMRAVGKRYEYSLSIVDKSKLPKSALSIKNTYNIEGNAIWPKYDNIFAEKAKEVRNRISGALAQEKELVKLMKEIDLSYTSEVLKNYAKKFGLKYERWAR